MTQCRLSQTLKGYTAEKKRDMKNRLYIVEGLPCSGKSSISRYISELLGKLYRVCYVDEGSGAHPADYEFHAFLSEEELADFSPEERKLMLSCSQRDENGYVLPLSAFEGELFGRLLQYKIYDMLPWEKERPVMLRKWRSFAETADKDTVYVFNCVLLQNPMCETMMRFGFDKEISLGYISEIADIIAPMNPVVIYLRNDDISECVRKASGEREGWLEAVTDYHVNGAYGKSIDAQGFEGYIGCLEERQERELDILSHISLESIVLDNAHRDWNEAYERIREIVTGRNDG